jgi:hypothetical protein
MSKLRVKNVKMIDDSDWDELVKKTYGRHYCLQQQDGCKDRGIEYITVPCECEDLENDTVPEKVNHPEMGVSFKAWLARDPKQKLSNKDDQFDFCINMWWERNFYPLLDVVANDLYNKGLLEAGDYSINIDW